MNATAKNILREETLFCITAADHIDQNDLGLRGKGNIMRTVTIELPQEVCHWLEICAAKDELRLSEGISRLLTNIVRRYEIQKRWNLRKKAREGKA